MAREVVPTASAAPTTATRGQPMTIEEAQRVQLMDERIRALDLWRAEHETKCTRRHEAIGLRFNTAKREMSDAFEAWGRKIGAQIDKSNSLRLVGMAILGVLVVLVGIKQPAALFELLSKM